MGNFGRKASALVCAFALCWSAFGNGNTDKRIVKATEHRVEAEKKLIETASKYVGLRELTGHNDHPQIQAWLKQTGLTGRYAWCAASMAGIHTEAGIPNPNSARVVDWFKSNVVWKREWGQLPEFVDKKGMVGAIYYHKLGRYGHIILIIGEDKNNFYCYEGNTNFAGSNEGDGFYKTVRSKEYIAALADYCVAPNDFIELYDDYLQKAYRNENSN